MNNEYRLLELEALWLIPIGTLGFLQSGLIFDGNHSIIQYRTLALRKAL